MNCKKELNKEILNMAAKIQTEFPELSEPLDVMPIYYPPNGHLGVNRKDLKNYLESLNGILETYLKDQLNEFKINLTKLEQKDKVNSTKKMQSFHEKDRLQWNSQYLST